MKNEYLYEKLPFLKIVPRERQKQFEQYFQSAPRWLMDEFQVERLKKNTVFIKENAPADTIYFIGSGLVAATDYRVLGIAYSFMQFKKTYAFGGMEFIMNCEVYQTTLSTVTECTVVKLPRSIFEKWMYSDIHALKYEAALMGEYLLQQGRNERSFLLMQGADRLALMFVRDYDQYSRNGLLRVREPQKDMADRTGLCVKSVNRAVKKLLEEGLIARDGNRITVSREQYKKLRDVVSRKLEI